MREIVQSATWARDNQPMTPTPVSDQQLAHWRAIRPRRVAVAAYRAQYLAECGCLPDCRELATALDISYSRAWQLARSAKVKVSPRKKKRPTDHYGPHLKEVPRRPPNARRLAQALALLR